MGQLSTILPFRIWRNFSPFLLLGFGAIFRHSAIPCFRVTLKRWISMQTVNFLCQRQLEIQVTTLNTHYLFHQHSSNVLGQHCKMRTRWDNRKEVTIAQMFIFLVVAASTTKTPCLLETTEELYFKGQF